jgi:hypothetical protein
MTFFIRTAHSFSSSRHNIACLQAWRVGFCICRACIHLLQSLNTSAVYGPTIPFQHLSSNRLQQLCATFLIQPSTVDCSLYDTLISIHLRTLVFLFYTPGTVACSLFGT